jgi:hypothetical protein
MKKYVIVERYRKRDGFDFINEDTNGITEIWETMVPFNLKEEDKGRLKPKVFDNRSEAVKYKDTRQSQSNADWSENDYIYKRYGDSKPKWKVEEYFGDLFR